MCVCVCDGQGDGMVPSVRRTLQEDGNLTLARLEAVDAGVYECVATNSVASVVTSTQVIVERTFPRLQCTTFLRYNCVQYFQVSK